MLPAFRADGSLNVIVESPRGCSIKLKYDLETAMVALSRPLPAGLAYPFDWGFIPSTHAPDGDPLDAFIIWDSASYPGILVPCRPIGVLKVEQTIVASKRRERNDRIAALPIKAPRHERLTSVLDLSERARAEIEQFFLHVVAFEGKELRLLGWDGVAAAETLVREAASAFEMESPRRV